MTLVFGLGRSAQRCSSHIKCSSTFFLARMCVGCFRASASFDDE
eukprot:CAMPEP_0204205346 /NCGR_PEP_ID=MMETSP0361-20130328/70269_1 /ASSEMBLY_ACC=CAM_ASM_000343 /TAXON_ID=268821 /ORGANISM="Scrippsiella Hangoei, Strain SHTV-5" /LENGTH=43 /DNA_ID= /DNA_START= /DNA_END= /DNA_ORIENTATION=